MENLEQTILSQYANSPTLLQLIENMNEYIDPSINIDAFYNSMWNINTAEGYGLDVWGRIVGVGRILALPITNEDFGFEQASDANPFNQAPFYSGIISTTNYALSDTAYRALILIKALANISACTIPAYNKMLTLLFPNRGNAYVIDLGGMEMQLVFEFSLQQFEFAIIQQSGAFVAPTGVGFTIVVSPSGLLLGFDEAVGSSNSFGYGTFF